MHTIFRLENVKGKDHLRLGVDGRIILRMDFEEIRWESVEWIHVAQDRDRCQPCVNIRVPMKGGEFLD
jgi:hypothetical protein